MALLDIVIDVSDAQGQIDWPAVAAAGIKVAMIKATQGTGFTAHTWAANSVAATAAGIAVIPYHFLTNDDATAQANHFQAVAGLAQRTAYALDWEGQGTASPAQVDAIGQLLIAVTGRDPLGYWGIPGGNVPGVPSASMQTWGRWVPRYRTEPLPDFSGMGNPPSHSSPFNDATPFLFWQYTSTGNVGGINGNVDRSVASFDDADAMVAWVNGAPAAG
jgi:lysozyme